jgi:murein DD-endopeptidase MepM/ murein hydrolase activator NlpD
MKFLCVIISCAILFAYPHDAVFAAAKTKSAVKDDLDSVENAIIIDNLSLTADKPPVDEIPKEGSVIHDDGFDDTILDKVVKKSNKTLTKIDMLAELRQKDRRWHCTPYTVKKNDTLWDIAKSFDTSHRLIIRMNNISGPDQIKPGKEILIPNRNGILYTVKRGDTLDEISSTSKTSVASIKEQNPKTVKILKTGEKIFIPDAIAPKKSDNDEKIASHKNDKNEKKDKPEKETVRIQSARIKESKQQRTFRAAFIWPLKGRITSGFGTRSDPFSGEKRFHNGIDISAEIGTPVKAAADGEVIFAGWKDDYGKLVVVRHDNGYISVYGHNSEFKVSEGDKVQKGQILSLSGMTGAVTGAHLHFELQKYQTPLNPLRMLR